MYQGKHSAPKKPGKKNNKSKVTLISVLALVMVVAIGGTLAWLFTNTNGIINTFTPSSVPGEIVERFDGETKTSITVKNKGNIAAYVRVKLVTYRVNDEGQQIGGVATIPEFTLGTGWVKHTDGYYYYTVPVAAGASTGDLIASGSSITLQKYDDADGGKQVIEVLSESIQSVPEEAVGDAWGVRISENSVTDYTTTTD